MNDDLDPVRDLRSQVRLSEEKDLHAARRRLMVAMASPAPSHRLASRTVLRVAAVGAFGLTITAGVTVVQNLGPESAGKGSAGAPAWLPAANAETLAKRATEAAKAEDVYPRADQWTYQKNVVYVSPKAVRKSAPPPVGLREPLGSRYTTEWWFRGDGKKVAHRTGGGMLTKGSLHGADRAPQPNDPAYLRSLPLESSALLDRLKKDNTASGGGSDANAMFSYVQFLLQQVAPPPRLRAALYTVISELDGVGMEDKVRDLEGRVGVGIYRDAQGIRREIIIDPDTYAFLGLRDYYPEGKRSSDGIRFKEGEVVVAFARLADGIVDHAGNLASGPVAEGSPAE
ncbi:CU044_5270 family protein [Sphaerisporangium dianthi]|uniref:CU044_5270 family protein n=1 Tax=Sphaerisporangium dianthi TaxID=1436120 RepID=A0ABV9CPZ6_9ACTN